MASKERDSLILQISSAGRGSKVNQRQRDSWIHVATIVVVFGWLSLLTLHSMTSLTPDEGLLRQDVLSRLWKAGAEIREGRQLVTSSGETTIEGDIVIRDSELTDPLLLDAHLANPDRLWPSGVVEYRFYKTFPASSRKAVKRAMRYISSKVPCIIFQEATPSTVDYVLLRDGVKCKSLIITLFISGVKCKSELGRTGGQQVLHLNRGCFNRGLMVPVHELLHTLGFVHEHTRPDRDSFISLNEENIQLGAEKNFVKRKQGFSDFFDKGSVNPKNTPYDVLSLLHYGPQDFSKNGEDVLTFLHELRGQTWQEPHPDDPLSVVDEVELAMAYECENMLCTLHTAHVSQERLLQYIHFNRHHNTMLIGDAVKRIEELKEEMALVKDEIAKVKVEITEIRQDNSLPTTPGPLTVSPATERRSHQVFPIVWDQEEYDVYDEEEYYEPSEEEE